MGNNYNIKINHPQPSGEEIHKHMDFDALLEKYQAVEAQEPVRPSRIKYLYYLAGAAAAVAAMVFFHYTLYRQQGSFVTEQEYFAERPFVSPPLESIQPDFTSFIVNANKGGIYEYESGSRLVIPAAAFMDDYGRLIEGDVEIIYREHNDFIDFFLTGIPMVYDSAGRKYTLESAGMLEIYARQNGNEVRMAPDKEIEVQLVSSLSMDPALEVPAGYNIYKLDTGSRTWVYQDIDRMELLAIDPALLDLNDPRQVAALTLQTTFEEINRKYQAESTRIEASLPMPEEPVRPQRPDPNAYTFEMNFTGAYQAQQQGVERYQGTIWQVSPKNEDFDERMLRVQWEDTRLRQLSPWEYEITFISGTREARLIVNPVLTGPAYEQALDQFDEAQHAFEQEMSEREEQLADRKQALTRDKKAEEESARKTYLESIARLNEASGQPAEPVTVTRKVINRFRANGLGIWNCARPVLPQWQKVKASFADQNGKPLENLPVYLVDKTRNTIQRFLAQQGATVQYNLHSENLMWIVTEDNHLAICRPSAFTDIDAGKGDHLFQLAIIDRPVNSEADLREILRF